MLVSFAIENWACFRDRQEFSLETIGRVEDRFAFNTGISRYPRLNRAAAIYGPNGSGKSCFVDALFFMRKFVTSSARESQAKGPVGVKPFCLDLQSHKNPTHFEIAFIQEGVVYEYGFKADAERVWDEWLFVRPPNGRIQRWLDRSYDPGLQKYKWTFGPSFQGPREMWRKATRPNALYVSTAVQFNSEALSPIIEWFRNLSVIRSGRISPLYTSQHLWENPDACSSVLDFIQKADIQADQIRVRNQEFDYGGGNISSSLIPEFGFPTEGTDSLTYLGLDEQSDGTRQIFSLAALWLDAINHGRVVVIDELNHSLHPHLSAFLIEQINHFEQTSVPCAQLIATTHDVSLLQSREVLDRNQIWFTDKGADQAASITPLSDYRPRKKESLLRGYLGGRYGAIPNVVAPPI